MTPGMLISNKCILRCDASNQKEQPLGRENFSADFLLVGFLEEKLGVGYDVLTNQDLDLQRRTNFSHD
jgi:hypothetical protein